MTDKKIILKNVSKKYQSLQGETPALQNINLTVKKNEFIAVVGPSGCGKSTLLSIISGLVLPDEGSVYIDEKPIESICDKIGYMLQEDYLFDWRTVFENVKLGLEIQNNVNKNTKEKIYKLLKSYGLKDFARDYPGQLSGGMRQRVALARTLIINPEIILLDEPFSSLDYQSKLKLEEEVSEILNEDKKTVVLVTHDIAEAISMADRVIILSKRPGEIKKIIDIDFGENLTPLARRKVKNFQNYFDKIWKELDIDVEK